MRVVERTNLALRFSGDDLDPDEISRLLGVTPTHAHRSGDAMRPRASGEPRARQTGVWLLEVSGREPGDLEGQIDELLGLLPSDPDVWKSVSKKRPELVAGVFLQTINEGLRLSSTAIRALADRGFAIDFDIYGAVEESGGMSACGD